MVTDECGEGLPVAWLSLSFKLLRDNCGQLSPHWLMIDTTSQFLGHTNQADLHLARRQSLETGTPG